MSTHAARVERFWTRVNKSGPIHPTLGTACWLWTGRTDGKGYGLFEARDMLGTDRTNRIAWILTRGPIPAGLHTDHLCRVPRCVNPDHLEPVTPAENTRRGNSGLFNSSKTHCPYGHPYSGANLKVYSCGRSCIECRRASERKRPKRPRSPRPRGPVTYGDQLRADARRTA